MLFHCPYCFYWLLKKRYFNFKIAFKNKPYFLEATEISKFKWSLTGALGKRTKFQTFDVAQLVLFAESSMDEDQVFENNTLESKMDASKPRTLDLNDDVLLEKIEITDKSELPKNNNLKVIDQCILLACSLNVKNTNPEHGLTKEEMQPYVSVSRI